MHYVASISYLNINVEAYVDPLFLATFYRNPYKYLIYGMNGSSM